MNRPLYNWEIEIKEENDSNKLEFIRKNSSKLNLNNRFIYLSERIEIKEKYDLKEELLDEIIDESNQVFINKNNDRFYNDFKNRIDSFNNVIDDKMRVDLHFQFSTDYHDYYDALDMDRLVDEHNKYILYEQNQILSDFQRELMKYNRPISEEDINNLKSEYNTDRHDIFDEMDLYVLIEKHNQRYYNKQYDSALRFLTDKYDHYYSPVPVSEKNYIRDKFPEVSCDELVEDYNRHYFDRKLRSKITRNKVYYLNDYIRQNDWRDSNPYKVQISNQILKYKNSDPKALNKFTSQIIEFIEFFANYGLDGKYEKIILVPIPASTHERDKKSAMKKSIRLIENEYKNGCVNFNEGREREIINYNGLLIRTEDIKAAHLSNSRPTYNDHMRTISFNMNKAADFNKCAFILLDDITTEGKIMRACTDILIKNNIEKESIFRLAIGATVGWRNNYY